MAKSDFSKNLNQLEEVLEKYLVDKTPSIPDDWKELIVKFAPYLTIFGLIFLAPTILGAFGFGAYFLSFNPFYGRAFFGFNYWLHILFVTIEVVFMALAVSPLFKKEEKGWRYLYYGALVSGVSSLISFDLVGFIVGTGLSLYVLFQVKEYYK